MGRPRIPTEVLERNGSFTKNPQRRRPASPKSNNPIGDPPDHLSETEAAIWGEVLFDLPVGVATRPDRHALAHLCVLEAKARDQTITGIERNQLIKLFGLFGMTPGDRSRVSPAPSPNEDDPFSKFNQ